MICVEPRCGCFILCDEPLGPRCLKLNIILDENIVTASPVRKLHMRRLLSCTHITSHRCTIEYSSVTMRHSISLCIWVGFWFLVTVYRHGDRPRELETTVHPTCVCFFDTSNRDRISPLILPLCFVPPPTPKTYVILVGFTSS